MVRHFTDKELKEVLSSISLIADTREQVNDHILDYCQRNKIQYVIRKLDVGDYSAQIGDVSLERDIAIERKHNLDEIAGNFSADRERFEREFLRAKANGIKVHLIIEDASLDDIYLHNYRSKLTPQSFLASLYSWMVRFDITVHFCKKQNTPKVMYGILYYHARDALVNGEGGRWVQHLISD